MLLARSRPTLTAVAALTALLAAGCGGGKAAVNADPVAAVRAAGDKVVGAGTSKFVLTSETASGAQKVTFTGDGAFDYGAKTGTLNLKLDSGGQGGSIQERITGGNLYLALPKMPDTFYKLSLADVGGTSLGSSTDPSASFATLKGVSNGVQKVGTEQVRGEQTTHYKGTIDVQKAVDASTGLSRAVLKKGLATSGLKTLPFDAYIDKAGRLRKYVQVVQLPGSARTAGKPIASTTTLELFDFGTKVVVQVPAANQIKDGAPLLQALKGAVGGAG